MFKDRIFVGIAGHVLALRTADGGEIWRKKLASFVGGDITGVTLIGDKLYATCGGELTCLDPTTGHILWKNPLRGLGTGFLIIAGGDDSESSTQSVAARYATTAAATTATILSTNSTS